ncbi:inositol monophosphatase [Tamlana fucoidanivorans]|uniref:Inositol monophosphatase n=2 Tax=Allotamlana fucoidanivorans TaxID=2583814 RepID=A0A5C4SIV1_9FLAO|nr:inositol monophosphatase [Tamlana fucoidanivorans]
MAAAKIAGNFIHNYNKDNLKVLRKESGTSQASQVVTEVDLKCESLILNILKPTIKTYDLGLLTEESVDTKSRLEKDYFWCIDPLDGTLPFTESRSGYAVSIALVSKQGISQIGVVFDPVNQNLYHAIINQGAFKNHTPWHIASNTPHTLSFYFNGSFKTQTHFNDVTSKLNEVASHFGTNNITCMPVLGAVMNACQALEHMPSCFFAFPKREDGNGSIWDYAATACIYKEIGAYVGDIFGSPLHLNSKTSTFMNARGILFASNKNLGLAIQHMYTAYFQNSIGNV